jgi:hypothetical protein
MITTRKKNKSSGEVGVGVAAAFLGCMWKNRGCGAAGSDLCSGSIADDSFNPRTRSGCATRVMMRINTNTDVARPMNPTRDTHQKMEDTARSYYDASVPQMHT